MTVPVQTLAIAFVLGVLLIPIVRLVSFRTGLVAHPREDRWHRNPTPVLGGVAMYLAFTIAMVTAARGSPIRWELVAATGVIFALGLYDDLRQLSPPTKLVGQILAASLLIFFGYRINFTPWDLLNILLAFLWLVGITNAINLLDNMDGLAGGVALIAAGFLSYFFWQAGNQSLLVTSLALVGALFGFLVFNFPPARIFMGDSGSLFLGFSLAALSIAKVPRASNVFAVMGVPVLLLLLPILDTSLVTFTRLLRGQSPVQGGRDHTSHRLVAFGLSERQAVLVLYAIALASGVAGTVLESLDYDLSLVLIPVLLVSLALLAAYLGRLKIVSAFSSPPGGTITRLMVELTFKRRLLEVGLDFFLIGLAYYLAHWTDSGFAMDEAALARFASSLPIALAGVFVAYFLLGVYRGVWRYVGVEDLVRYLRAAVGGAALVALNLLLGFPGEGHSLVVFFLFAVFLFLGLAASRSSFRILDRMYVGQLAKDSESCVLIYDAGDAGEMVLRWILRKPEMGYRPVGFLDDDPFKWGRRIHGVDVLGDLQQLDSILNRQKIDGLILTLGDRETDGVLGEALEVSRARGVWVRRLRFEFELLEGEPTIR